MDYSLLKYILWILLCMPFLVLGLYFFFSLAGRIIAINKEKRLAMERERNEAARIREEEERDRLNREAFDREYDRRRGGHDAERDIY